MYGIQEKFEQVHKLYCFYLKKLMATNTIAYKAELQS